MDTDTTRFDGQAIGLAHHTLADAYFRRVELGTGISWAGFKCQSIITAAAYTVVGVVSTLLAVLATLTILTMLTMLTILATLDVLTPLATPSAHR